LKRPASTTASSPLEPLLASLGFLTVLPVARRPLGLPASGYALFPLVGLLLGGLLLGLDWLLSPALPPVARSALVVAALAGLTGALHLDGLADTADGLLAHADRSQRLRIMADPHNGAFGFVAVAVVLLLKWAALIPLEGWLRGGALLLAPALARGGILLPLSLFPPAREEGMGAAVARALRPRQALLGLGLTAALSLAIFWPFGALLALAALAVAWGLGRLATARLGGTTGDVLGAAIELAEATVLLLCASSTQRGWLT